MRIGYGWFVDTHWELRVIPAAGGQPQVLFNRFFPLDWSPDGRHFVGWLRGRTLALVSISGAVTKLRTWDTVLHTPWMRATFSPDGRAVAYDATVGARSQVFLIDLASIG